MKAPSAMLIAFVIVLSSIFVISGSSMTIDDWDITPLNAPDYDFFNFNGQESTAIWTTSEGVNYILAVEPGGGVFIYTDESGEYVGAEYELITQASGNTAIWYNEDTDELCTAYSRGTSRYGLNIGDVHNEFYTYTNNGHQFRIGSDYSFHVIYEHTDYDDFTYYNYSCYSNGIWTNETIHTHDGYVGGLFEFDLTSSNTPYFAIMKNDLDTTNATFINGVGGTSFSFNTDKYIGYGRFFLNDDEPYFVYPEIELNETVTGSLGQVTQSGVTRIANLYGADSIEIAMGIEYTFTSDSIGRLHGFYSLYYPATDNYQLRYICKDGSTIYQQLLLVNDSETFSIDTQSIFIDANGILRGVCLDMDTIVFYVYETQLSFGPPPPALAWTTASPPTTSTEGEIYSYTFITNMEGAGFNLTTDADWLNLNSITGLLSGLTRIGSHRINITASYDGQSIYHEYVLVVSEPTGRAQAVIEAEQIGTYKVAFNFTTTMPQGRITSIMWDFGDGSVVWYSGEGIGIKAPGTIHRYNTTGDYHVTLVIKDINDISVRAAYFLKLNDTEGVETSSYGDFSEFNVFVIKIVGIGLLVLIAAALYESTKKGRLSGYHPALLLLIILGVVVALSLSLIMEGI